MLLLLLLGKRERCDLLAYIEEGIEVVFGFWLRSEVRKGLYFMIIVYQALTVSGWVHAETEMGDVLDINHMVQGDVPGYQVDKGWIVTISYNISTCLE